MTGIKHTFVSEKADGEDTSVVRPSNWNADHSYDADMAHGVFYTTSSQTVASTTTAYAVAFEGEDEKDNLTHSNSTNPSRIQFNETGSYAIFVSAIADITTGSNQTMECWLAIDGSPVANTNTICRIATASTETIIAVPYIVHVSAGQYFEIMYRGSSTATRFVQTGTQINPTRPASPAVIVSVQKISPTILP